MKNDKNDKIDPLKKTFFSRVSAFKNVWSKEAKATTLFKWLYSTIYDHNDKIKRRAELVEKIRSASDAEDMKELKKQLPVITPGALMEPNAGHSIEDIKNITAWMQVDIDLKENPHLPDAPALRNAISYNPYIAYCGLSVSGNGVWGLVQVSNKDQYKAHFDQLVEDFKDAGIILDTTKGRNPHDLRFYSFDANAHVCPEFRIYDRIKRPKPLKQNAAYKPLQTSEPSNGLIEKAIHAIEKTGTDITATYEAWFQCGCAIANELGDKGRDYYHRISQFYPDYKPEETDRKFNDCLKADSKVNVNTLLYWCKEYGILLKDQFRKNNSLPQTSNPQPKPTESTNNQPNNQPNNITSTGMEVWDPSQLLRNSGLYFLCTPEPERQWDKPLTKSEQTFELMKAKNPKIGELTNRLAMKIN